MYHACERRRRIKHNRVLVGTPEGKRPLGRPRSWREDMVILYK
jgi:hypothetical protein